MIVLTVSQISLNCTKIKNINEMTLQKIPLSNIDRFDYEIDIFVNQFTQQMFMICSGYQKNHLQEETV